MYIFTIFNVKLYSLFNSVYRLNKLGLTWACKYDVCIVLFRETSLVDLFVETEIFQRLIANFIYLKTEINGIIIC